MTQPSRPTPRPSGKRGTDPRGAATTRPTPSARSGTAAKLRAAAQARASTAASASAAAPEPAAPASVPASAVAAGGGNGKGPDQSGLKGVARGSSANLVGAAVSTVTNFGLIVALTHELARRDAGIFFSATSLFLLLETAAGLGTSTAAVYFLPRLHQERDVEGVRTVLRLATRLVTAASVVGILILFALPQHLGQAENHSGHHHGIDLLWVLAFLLPFAVLGDIYQASSRGFGSMKTTVVVEKIARPAVQMAAVFVAALTHDLIWVSVAWGAPYIPAALVSIRDLQRRTRTFLSEPWPWPRRDSHVGGAFARYSFPRALSGVASLALQRLDIVLVDAFKGPADAALYTAATRFLVVGQFLGQSILLAMQPRVSALLGRRAMRETEQLFRITTGWLVLLTWPMYVTVAVFPHVFLTLFGRGYSGGSAVVIVLALSMLAATIVGQVDVMIAMGGRSWYSLANISLSLAVNVALNLVLIPKYGIVGAAIAWSAAIIIGNAVALLEVRAMLDMHPFGGATLTTAAVAAACFGVPGVTQLVGFDGAAQVGAFAVGGAVYVLWLYRARTRLHLAELAGAGTERFRTRRPPAPVTAGSET